MSTPACGAMIKYSQGSIDTHPQAEFKALWQGIKVPEPGESGRGVIEAGPAGPWFCFSLRRAGSEQDKKWPNPSEA